LITFYASVGRSANKELSKKGPHIFEGVKPPIWQTPGRVQYYRAENEPFLPSSVKWDLRYPTRYATRAL